MLDSPVPASRPVATSTGSGDVLGLRISAALIDLAILFVLFLLLSVMAGEVTSQGGQTAFLLDGADFATYLALVFVYYLVLEATLGRTVGKLLLGLQVVGWDGGRPSVVAVAIRTILRIVDWLPVLYLVGFVAMLVTGERRQRLGDLVAETRVQRTSPIRHRGFYAALLAVFLFAAVAVPVVSTGVLGGLLSSLTYSSVSCVMDRCNATVRGDQVLDLSGHAVAVSDVGTGNEALGTSPRATFTVDGDTVTLRVGETRQVGSSRVHLTSVEVDVAKFSVDFGGPFVNGSDLGDASRGQTSSYDSYTPVTDDQDVVTVEVPVEWDDVDGREDPEYGPSIVAAPDLEQYERTWDVPGIMVEVSSRYGADDISTMLDEIGPSEQCRSEGREAYDDPPYRGEIQRWTGCGGTDTTVLTAAVAPADSSYLILIIGQAVDARDLAAFERALATVDVSTVSAVPSESIVTEEDWLKKVEGLRSEIDDAIGYEDAELTTSVMTDMATAMRMCSRTLASGPSGARLQRLHTLVGKACAEYDKGADCLATAADIGSPEVGSAEDRKLTKALNCGFDGLNRGGELLIDAEFEAEDLLTTQPR